MEDGRGSALRRRHLAPAYAAAARLLPRLSAAAELAAIVVYALLSWVVYQWLVMPWLAPTMDKNTSAVSLAVAHVVLALGLAAWWIPRTRRSPR